MDQGSYPRHSWLLWGLTLVGLAYSGAMGYAGRLTGYPRLDGSLGVLLGLYICSRPAAHAIDLLFFQRSALRQMASEGAGVRWLGLNLLVFLVGWLVITVGTTHLIR